jgi:hypothetical protein
MRWLVVDDGGCVYGKSFSACRCSDALLVERWSLLNAMERLCICDGGTKGVAAANRFLSNVRSEEARRCDECLLLPWKKARVFVGLRQGWS